MKNAYKVNEEAVKKIAERVYDNGSTVINRNDLEEMFPELKESENERIRKWLIHYFKEVCDNVSEKEKKGVIAWLEKQGDNASDKIVEKARTEKQRVLLTETDGSASIDWDCRSLDDVKVLLKCGLDFIHDVEASKQILTDSRFGGCSFRIPTRYDKGIKQGSQNLANSAKTCKDEQKPAWSEEDKKFINEIEESLLAYKIIVIDNDRELANYIEKEINWLKSLRHQKLWKPSYFQIEALESATANCAYSEYEDCLKELIKQLKNLI